jgi:iron complex outermembrane receptor protein
VKITLFLDNKNIKLKTNIIKTRIMKKDFFIKLLFFIFIIIGKGVYAQNITGVVLGDDGVLPGATIQIKGTNIGVTSDFDGNFSIEADQNDTLIVSYIGYSTQEVEVNNQDNITVNLESDSILDEVVIIGYGTQKKEEITSAIATIKSEDFNGGNINDPTQLLQGKIAGLNVTRAGSDPNEPFTLRLRGLSTFGANAEPLVIIDGVIGGTLDAVDPSDIESVNVLKDAAAAAIYGTRGSSGVIIVNTKSGKGLAKSGFEYRGYLSSEQISNRIQYASYDEFLSYGGLDLGSRTDWVDEVTRTAMSNVHNLSYSGSSDNGLSYRASLNVRDIEGIQTTSGFEQINARVNVFQKLLDDKLRFQTSIGITSRDASKGFQRALTAAQPFNPTAPIYNPDGTFYQNVGVDRSFNPVAINDQSIWDLDTNTMLANFKAEYDITSNLTVSTSYSTQFKTMTDGKYYDNDDSWVGNSYGGRGGRAEKTTSDEKFDLSEFTVTYNGELNDLNYEVLAGYAYQEFTFSNQYAYNTDFLTNETTYNAMGLGLGIKDGRAGMTSFKQESKLASAFARLNLNYQNLAFFSASIRNEESSRFGANNRSGTFWATSAGVDLNKIFDINGVDQFKFRAGYGLTGNEPNQRLAYLATLGTATDPSGNIVNGYVNGNYVTALGPSSNPNPDLKWEEKTELNIGIDFIVLDSKLSGSIDYFVRNTLDLLRVTPVASPPNIFPSTLLNLGELDTKGFEIALNYSPVSTANLKWDVAFNIANFDVTLVNLSDQDDFVSYSGFLPGNINELRPIVLQEGERLGNIRAGIFAGYDSDGRTLIINEETGQPSSTDRVLERDGVIVGNALPDYTFGLNNTLIYKDWDLNIMLRGAIGHSIVNAPRIAYEYSELSGTQNFVMTTLFDPDNRERGGIYHSGHVEKADFLRLDNATIGYNIKMSESSKIDNLRLYVAGNNLFTITDYTGADPEVRYTERSWVQGNEIDTNIDILSPGLDKIEFGYFPTSVYTIGVNISF